MESPLESRRTVLPRWRPFCRTLPEELGSAAPSKVSSRLEAPENHKLQILYDHWREEPTLENAAEVVEHALTLRSSLLAVGPASMILDNENAMPAAKTIARAIVEGPRGPDFSLPEVPPTREEIHQKIHAAKIRLIDEPRNALLWTEKARLYTLIGDFKQAEHSLDCSLNCSPNNRFILRVYSRFCVHTGNPDRAHEKLTRSEGLRSDPWLQAAEMAIAGLAGKGALSASAAKRVIEKGDIDPIHTSESSAALATLEVESGKTRVARRLFENCLRKPTENSVAQVLWAREGHKLEIVVSPAMLDLAGAYEARLQSALVRKRWRDAAEHCREWLNDEPYSVRVAVLGSFISASYTWDFEQALEFCDRGLFSNPDDSMLINNKVVALLRSGRLEEARAISSRLFTFDQEREFYPEASATLGMLAFRSGDIAEGRRRYEKVVEEAKRRGSTDVEFRALMHWYFEEKLAGNVPEETVEVVEKAIDKNSNVVGVMNSSRDTWHVMKDQMKQRSEGIKSTQASQISFLDILS